MQRFGGRGVRAQQNSRIRTTLVTRLRGAAKKLLAIAWRSLPLALLKAIDRIAKQKRTSAIAGPIAPGGRPRVEVLLRFMPGSKELMSEESGTLFLNSAALGETKEMAASLRQALKRAQERASGANKAFVICLDWQPLAEDLITALHDRSCDAGTVDTVINAITWLERAASRLPRSTYWHQKVPLPRYDTALHDAAVRYGNAELRVVEDYLTARDAQRRALERLAPHIYSERRMYAPSGEILGANDREWNLRRLMTNAGFYIDPQIAPALETLEDWASRYVSALRNSQLIWHNNIFRYYLRTMVTLFDRYGRTPAFVRPPTLQTIYRQLSGKNVLFVSPLAHLANEQYRSGNIRRLYRNYDVPAFSIRAIPAFVSTWPNRPHRDWSETFGRLRDSIDNAWRESPFEYFIASCGCYGLPICDYVRAEFGCRVLYVGNLTHALFGIRQRSTPAEMEINEEAWVDSDLGRYPNMGLIDSGSYLAP